MESWVGMVGWHSGQFTYIVVTCQPQIGRRWGKPQAKDRRPNHWATAPTGGSVILLTRACYIWNGSALQQVHKIERNESLLHGVSLLSNNVWTAQKCVQREPNEW